MSKIREIEKLVEQAFDAKMSAAGKFNVFQQSYLQERSKVRNAFKGNDNALQVFENQQRREFFYKLKEEREAYNDTLERAKELSERIINEKAPKPSEDVVQRFEGQLSELKTELLLSSPEDASKKLVAFVEKVDDPYLIGRIKDEYYNLTNPILTAAGNNASQLKPSLLKVFTKVKEAALTEEARQATKLLERATALQESELYSSVITNRVVDHFGFLAAKYVNDPDNYFTSAIFKTDAEVKPGELTSDEKALENALAFATNN